MEYGIVQYTPIIGFWDENIFFANWMLADFHGCW
jgi:hypothetical protein